MREVIATNKLRFRAFSYSAYLAFLLAIVLAFITPVTAVASDLVRDERRVWSDGTPQEVWTYAVSIAPENLVQKDLYYENGDKRRREKYAAGVQHGSTTAWYEEGTKELEEVWVNGGRHGLVRQWPNPRNNIEYKKQLKPSLEATWENGEPSGLWREWRGWTDDRWLRIEKSYVDGKLDGFETVWRSADSMDRKHSYVRGVLDGRQFAWDYNGEMLYQYQFADGEPDGPQRKYQQDVILQELLFVDGKLHGTMTWESWLEKLGSDWEDGLRSNITTREDGTTKRIRRWSFVPTEQFDSNGYLQFHGEKLLFDDTLFDELGYRELLKISGPPRSFTYFWPDGQVRRAGKGKPSSPKGEVLEYYEDGVLHREEAYLDGQRSGTWLVHDRKGRVVSRQTWDYNLKSHVVTEWHSDEVKAAEGPVQHGHGKLSGRKIGEWNYWTADGRLLRTETYGSGPYSGNRAFIGLMTEWDSDDRIVFEGSEKELILFEYDHENVDRVIRRKTVKLLDRSRHGVESWDPETFQIIRADVGKKKELHEDAKVVEVLGGRALTLVDARFRADGTAQRTETYSSKGALEGVQEGWYRNGKKAYSFTYTRGRLALAEEWWPDGAVRLVAEFVKYNSAGDNQVRSLAIRNEKGKAWRLDERVQPWKGPEKLLEKCQLWRFAPTTPKP